MTETKLSYYERHREEKIAYRRQYYQKNRGECLKADKERYKRNQQPRIEYQRKYRNSNKNQVKDYRRTYYQEHLEKTLQQQRERNNAFPEKVRAGSIARRDTSLECKCSICGSTENLERHHPDYDRPLDVVTLCRSCHCRVHSGTLKIMELLK